MAKELNATCKICGQKYHMCRTCSSNKGTWESWMQHTDTKDCFKIFTILYDNRIEKISDAEAKDKLQKCDLSKLETFKDGIKENIKRILGVTDITEKKVEEEKVEIKETDVEEKTTTKKKSIVSKLK